MSEGERVVYIDSQLPTRPRWDNGDYRDFYDRDVPFLLSVAKKVPALEARIAELEGIFKRLELLVSDGKGFEVESHPDGATILLTEHDGATTYEMETQRSVFDALVWAADFAASREPTPAAAKET